MTAGVALDNGMAYLHEQRVAQDIALLKNAQFIGLFLTSFGTILLFVEIYQFIRRNKQLVALKLAKAPVFTSSVMLSVLVLA